MPHIYRVVVRGEFDGLGPEDRAALLADADAHDIFRSAYTAAGTLTYERSLHAFSYRYEVREPTDDRGEPECRQSAADRALAAATSDLSERGLSAKRLRTEVTNMAEMWH